MELVHHSKRSYDAINCELQETIKHSLCVSNLASRIAKELGYEEQQCNELAIAGFLHDIGKLKLSNYLYGDDSNTMTVEKLKYIRMHTSIGHQILKQYDYSDFILTSILHHHENYDGSGYPDNQKGEDIPIGARVLRVCDVFSALISKRPYRCEFSMDAAVELMIEEVKNFDMKIFLVFLTIIHEKEVRECLDRCLESDDFIPLLREA